MSDSKNRSRGSSSTPGVKRSSSSTGNIGSSSERRRSDSNGRSPLKRPLVESNPALVVQNGAVVENGNGSRRYINISNKSLSGLTNSDQIDAENPESSNCRCGRGCIGGCRERCRGACSGSCAMGCRGCCSKFCGLLTCGKCTNCCGGERVTEGGESDDEVTSVPGVMLSPKVIGPEGSVKGLCNENASTGQILQQNKRDKNLSTVLDFAAKQLNVLIKVDEKGSLGGAIDVLASRISHRDEFEEMYFSHSGADIYYSFLAFKPGSTMTCNWKSRFFKLLYNGTVQYFQNETSVKPKGFFQLSPNSQIELLGDLKNKQKFQINMITGPAKFLVACSSLEEASALGIKLRNIVEVLKRKKSLSSTQLSRGVGLGASATINTNAAATVPKTLNSAAMRNRATAATLQAPTRA